MAGQRTGVGGEGYLGTSSGSPAGTCPLSQDHRPQAPNSPSPPSGLSRATRLVDLLLICASLVLWGAELRLALAQESSWGAWHDPQEAGTTRVGSSVAPAPLCLAWGQ